MNILTKFKKFLAFVEKQICKELNTIFSSLQQRV